MDAVAKCNVRLIFLFFLFPSFFLIFSCLFWFFEKDVLVLCIFSSFSCVLLLFFSSSCLVVAVSFTLGSCPGFLLSFLCILFVSSSSLSPASQPLRNVVAGEPHQIQ